MTNPSHEINLALRTAAGHERAAHAAEAGGAKIYEMKMISAGAAKFSAFKRALAAQHPHARFDDAAARRFYLSTRSRPWWKRSDSAKRSIQWHLDPEAARRRCERQKSRRRDRRFVTGQFIERVHIETLYAFARARSAQTGVLHHVDHVVPLSRGGQHVRGNLQILTAVANLKKGGRAW